MSFSCSMLSDNDLSVLSIPDIPDEFDSKQTDLRLFKNKEERSKLWKY